MHFSVFFVHICAHFCAFLHVFQAILTQMTNQIPVFNPKTNIPENQKHQIIPFYPQFKNPQLHNTCLKKPIRWLAFFYSPSIRSAVLWAVHVMSSPSPAMVWQPAIEKINIVRAANKSSFFVIFQSSLSNALKGVILVISDAIQVIILLYNNIIGQKGLIY